VPSISDGNIDSELEPNGSGDYAYSFQMEGNRTIHFTNTRDLTVDTGIGTGGIGTMFTLSLLAILGGMGGLTIRAAVRRRRFFDSTER